MKTTLEDAFMAVHQKMAATLRRRAKNLDYTFSQMAVLHFVIAEREPTMKEIAQHLGITAPSATALVERLHADKLVLRKADPRDRRGVRVYPTPKTVALFSKFQKLKAAAFSEILRPLSSSDREHLATILSKLT